MLHLPLHIPKKKAQSGIKRIGQKFNQTGAEIEISNH